MEVAKFRSFDQPVTAGEAVDDLALEPGAEDEGEYEGEGGGHHHHNHPLLNIPSILLAMYIVDP
jgi:hypothetical protein